MSLFTKLSTLIKEKRLPYSWEEKIQNTLYKEKLDKCLLSVLETPAIACDSSADTEVHMQTSAKDLPMAIVAAKSLLRFVPNIVLKIHEDGSFKTEEFEFCRQHIPNSEVISPLEANEIAKGFPELDNIRNSFLGRFNLPPGFESRIKSRQQKIFDLHTTSKTEKVVYLDSDTIFLVKPVELIDWMNDDEALPFHTRPKLPNLTVKQHILVNVFPDYDVIPAFNSGFFGFRKSQLSVSLVADITQKLLDHPEVEVLGDESVWRFMYSAINCYCFDFHKYPLFELKERYREIKDHPELRYLHFLGKHKHGIYEKIARKTISELG